jgi:general secretion pathway protein F
MQAVPAVGPWLIQGEIGRWATVLGALLNNRVPIVTAMELAQGVLRLDALRSGLERATRGLQQGQALSAGLETQAWFPRTRLNLIRVGERSGELPRMLIALGHSQRDAAALLQRRMLGLIEPIAILFIGAVIGVVMVAVMMAITSFDTLVS